MRPDLKGSSLVVFGEILRDMVNDYCVEVLKSKLHRAEVTGANVNYEGSLSISQDLMDLVGIVPFEKILCGNQATGDRFETYAIRGPKGTGEIVLNGAAARLGEVGDLLTIMTFAQVTMTQAQNWAPRVAVLSERNHQVENRVPVATSPMERSSVSVGH